MDRNFEAARKLFMKYFGGDQQTINDFELVTELDAIRDGSVQDENLSKIFKEEGRIAVPDIFLRCGNNCLVIEAKMFTYPTDDEMNKQLLAQKKLIDRFTREGYYADHVFKQLLIATDKYTLAGFECLTWQILKDEIIAEDNNGTPESNYCRRVLFSAIARAQTEAETSGPGDSIRVTPQGNSSAIQQLIERSSTMIKDGYVFVGIDGGSEQLKITTADELRARSHYKVGKRKRSAENWLLIGTVLNRIIETGAHI